METTETASIACTLDGGSLKQRLAWISGLNARALRSSRRDDLRLTLDYDPAALEEVREMVRGEQACCAFLRFDTVDGDDAVTLTITAPEGAREAAEELFGPLAAREPQEPASCGCTSGCGA